MSWTSCSRLQQPAAQENRRRMLAEPNRLFRHDALVVINEARTTLAKLSDRVVIALFLLALLGALHVGLAGQPWDFAAALAGCGALIAGITTGRTLHMRLAFHEADGVLAVDALKPGKRRRYLTLWTGAGLVAVTAVTLLTRPSLGVVTLPTYLIGALAAYAASGFAQTAEAARGRLAGLFAAAVSGRTSGVIGSALFLFSLVAAQILHADSALAVVAVVYTGLVLMMTRVDPATVRFMALVGLTPWRIILRYSWALASLTAMAVPACWLVMGPSASGLIAVIAITAWVISAVRVLAYGIFRKRLADLMVVGIAATVTWLAFSAPVLLPLLVLASLWRLHHLASKRTWIAA